VSIESREENRVSTPQRRTKITPEEYLEIERQAETKSEYYAGEMFALSGASRYHNRIVRNLIATLHNRLRGGPCEVFPSDMRVKVEASGLYTYPDVSVVCGEAEFEDEHFDTLVNPTVVIEVLSRSTADYDRGRKAEHYRRLDSIREILLVWQDEIKVERHRRVGGSDWLLSAFAGTDAVVELASVACALPLSEVYERVWTVHGGTEPRTS